MNDVFTFTLKVGPVPIPLYELASLGIGFKQGYVAATQGHSPDLALMAAPPLLSIPLNLLGGSMHKFALETKKSALEKLLANPSKYEDEVRLGNGLVASFDTTNKLDSTYKILDEIELVERDLDTRDFYITPVIGKGAVVTGIVAMGCLLGYTIGSYLSK